MFKEMTGVKDLIYGAIGGIIGGIAMAGAIMGMDAMLTTSMSDMFTDWLPRVIGMTPDAGNLMIGLAMHMMMSVVYGALFAIVFDLLGREENIISGLIFGAIYGIILMGLAMVGFMVMPMVFAGFPDVIAIAMGDMLVLGGMVAGHVMFGIITGVVYTLLK